MFSYIWSAWSNDSLEYWAWSDLPAAAFASSWADEKLLRAKVSEVDSVSDVSVRQTQIAEIPSPKTWPFRKKAFHTALPAVHGLIVTMGTSIYAPGIESIVHEFNVSQEVALLGLAFYSLGLGLGPLIAAPISETLGRKGVYAITGVLFLIFTAGAGAAQNIATLVTCRLFAAVFGSPALAVSAGSIADIWEMTQGGGLASVLLTSTYFLGPFIGPVIGGYTLKAQDNNWRWLMWAIVVASIPILIAIFFSKETYLKQIQKKKSKELGIEGPPKPPFKQFMKMMLIGTLLRPLKMIVTEPIVASWAIYHSFVFGVMYALFDSYYYIFHQVYAFDISQIGLTFLGIAIGIVLATLTFCIINKIIYQRRRKQSISGKPPPEERLYICMLGSVGMPISLFWFALTAREDIHWLSPVAAGVPFGWSSLCLFLGGVTYLLDTYGAQFSASAMAANGIMRYTFGMAFPLFTTQMYEGLGIQWATCLLAFVSIALLPIPFILYKFGLAIRSKSVFKSTPPPR